jgi:signal peptidase II
LKLRRWLSLLVVIAVVLVVDQGSKQLVIQNLALGETVRPIPFLSPLFQFTRSHNTGVAFGLLPQAGDFFLILAVIVVGGLLIYYPRIPDHQRLLRFSLGMIAGGALGNALDRLEFGHVVDFIHYQIPGLVSNVSNIADHAIVVGVLLYLLATWQEERRTQSTAAGESAPEVNPQ